MDSKSIQDVGSNPTRGTFFDERDVSDVSWRSIVGHSSRYCGHVPSRGSTYWRSGAHRRRPQPALDQHVDGHQPIEPATRIFWACTWATAVSPGKHPDQGRLEAPIACADAWPDSSRSAHGLSGRQARATRSYGSAHGCTEVKSYSAPLALPFPAARAGKEALCARSSSLSGSRSSSSGTRESSLGGCVHSRRVVEGLTGCGGGWRAASTGTSTRGICSSTSRRTSCELLLVDAGPAGGGVAVLEAEHDLGGEAGRGGAAG